jgi:hypothetical protein
MVLHPLDSPAPIDGTAPIPAWAAVAERQKCHARAYWLISQPDHAQLAGDLAANFVSRDFPHVNPELARAIGVHDSGWGIFGPEANTSDAPFLSGEGKPLAFIEFEPEQFLRAWTGSIERAEAICAAGGIIVSRHFCELGRMRLAGGGLTEEGRQLIADFEERENSRQARLLPQCSESAEELDALLEVLKFCDLLSLYLCSGAQHEAEFGQKLTSRPVRVRQSESMYIFSPSPFQAEESRRVVNLGVRARQFPSNGKPEVTSLSFLLA